MSPLLDNLLVVAALAASGVYALFKLGPSSLSRSVLSYIAGWARRAPAWSGLQALAARLGAAAAKSSGSCGGCDNCGSDGGSAQGSPPANISASLSASLSAGPSASGPASRSASGSEIKIPLASIGRRRE
jgi:hypothetical protein